MNGAGGGGEGGEKDGKKEIFFLFEAKEITALVPPTLSPTLHFPTSS